MRVSIYIICAAALSLCLLSCAKKSASNNNTMDIAGQIQHTRTYCGGAQPSEALLKEYRTPVPLSGHVLSIRQGISNAESSPVIATVTTDKEGKFNITLPTGHYVLLLPSQVNRDIFNPQKDLRITDRTGLDKWWTMGIAQINSTKTDIALTLHKKCDIPLAAPHIRFTGHVRP